MKARGLAVIIALFFLALAFFPRVVFAEKSVDDAVNWAEGQVNSANWINLCFVFVRSAYGEGSVPGIDQAKDAWYGNFSNVFGEKHTDRNFNDIPRGALVFFDLTVNGHVGLAIGSGKMIHAWVERVEESNISDSVYADHYLGWRWPSTWTDSPYTIDLRIVQDLGWYPSNKTCASASQWYRVADYNGKKRAIQSLMDNGYCFGMDAITGGTYSDVLVGNGDIPQMCQ